MPQGPRLEVQRRPAIAFRPEALALRVAKPGSEERDGPVGERGARGGADLAFVDQGYTGEQPREDAEAQGIRLAMVKHPQAKRGFVPLPRRWVVERSFAWAARFRRLAKDHERLPAVLAGLHLLAFVCLAVAKVAPLLASGA